MSDCKITAVLRRAAELNLAGILQCPYISFNGLNAFTDQGCQFIRTFPGAGRDHIQKCVYSLIICTFYSLII